MIHATIKEIGENAVSEQEPILILFDRTATTTLRNYSVIQKITSTEKFSLKKGDSLYSMAQKYNTTVGQIVSLNNLSSNLLVVGQQLLISPQCYFL